MMDSRAGEGFCSAVADSIREIKKIEKDKHGQRQRQSEIQIQMLSYGNLNTYQRNKQMHEAYK